MAIKLTEREIRALLYAVLSNDLDPQSEPAILRLVLAQHLRDELHRRAEKQTPRETRA